MDDMPFSFAPYEGPEPFIFVSYSHRDTETVFPILESMCQQGYRIWYDEGIPWSFEWMNTIYDHLEQSAVCLVFHSSNSVASMHCKAEISEMLSDKKAIVSVYLEDVKIERGLRMYLRQFQAVKLYQFRGLENFMKRLNAQSVFMPCKGASQGDSVTISVSEWHSDKITMVKGKPCPVCGRVSDSKFCPDCGSPMDTPESSPVDAAQIPADGTVDGEAVTETSPREEILWVDDKPKNNAYERETLRNLGISITVASSTQLALRYLKNHKISLIVSNMARKEGSKEGYVLLDAVRKFNATIPFIMYTDFASIYKQETLSRGGQGAIGRPEELVDLVLKYLNPSK